MTEHEAEQQRIISIVEDIEHVDAIASSLDYEISVASEDEIPNLEHQFRKFQGQSNDMVNYLKGEGYTLDYDGPLVYLSKDGKPWMERTAKGDWIETKPVPEEQAATSEALAVFTQFLDMLKNGPDETLELFKLVTSINHPAISQERRVSKIETTCPICGYQEDVIFTPEFYQEHNGKFVDILASMLELMGNCPECEDVVRVDSSGFYNMFPDREEFPVPDAELREIEARRLANIEDTLMEAAINNDDNLSDLVQVAIETLDEETAYRLMDKIHQIQKEALADIRGWKDYDKETSFAVGECPNCGHDWTAHSAYIGNQQKTCEEVLDGVYSGYRLRIEYTDQDKIWYAQAYKGDTFVCQKYGNSAIRQCKAAITKRINADKKPLPPPIHTPPGFVDDIGDDW